MAITLDQQIKCLRDETKRRERVFTHLVDQGKYTQEQATHEIETMRKALETLAQLRALSA